MIEDRLGYGLRAAEAKPFVEVMYARSTEEAALCCGLLEDARIPTHMSAGFNSALPAVLDASAR